MTQGNSFSYDCNQESLAKQKILTIQFARKTPILPTFQPLYLFEKTLFCRNLQYLRKQKLPTSAEWSGCVVYSSIVTIFKDLKQDDGGR